MWGQSSSRLLCYISSLSKCGIRSVSKRSFHACRPSLQSQSSLTKQEFDAILKERADLSQIVSQLQASGMPQKQLFNIVASLRDAQAQKQDGKSDEQIQQQLAKEDAAIRASLQYVDQTAVNMSQGELTEADKEWLASKEQQWKEDIEQKIVDRIELRAVKTAQYKLNTVIQERKVLLLKHWLHTKDFDEKSNHLLDLILTHTQGEVQVITQDFQRSRKRIALMTRLMEELSKENKVDQELIQSFNAAVQHIAAFRQQQQQVVCSYFDQMRQEMKDEFTRIRSDDKIAEGKKTLLLIQKWLGKDYVDPRLLGQEQADDSQVAYTANLSKLAEASATEASAVKQFAQLAKVKLSLPSTSSSLSIPSTTTVLQSLSSSENLIYEQTARMLKFSMEMDIVRQDQSRANTTEYHLKEVNVGPVGYLSLASMVNNNQFETADELKIRNKFYHLSPNWSLGQLNTLLYQAEVGLMRSRYRSEMSERMRKHQLKIETIKKENTSRRKAQMLHSIEEQRLHELEHQRRMAILRQEKAIQRAEGNKRRLAVEAKLNKKKMYALTHLRWEREHHWVLDPEQDLSEDIFSRELVLNGFWPARPRITGASSGMLSEEEYNSHLYRRLIRESGLDPDQVSQKKHGNPFFTPHQN